MNAFLKRLPFWRLAGMGARLVALWNVFRHSHAPLLSRALALGLMAYMVSPVDFIPDFIPVLGVMDDVAVLALGLGLMGRVTPKSVWQDCQDQASRTISRAPRLLAWAAGFVVLWLVLLALLVWGVSQLPGPMSGV